MTGATHFIEVYYASDLELTNALIEPIGLLKGALAMSKDYEFKTIAIWKIKLK